MNKFFILSVLFLGLCATGCRQHSQTSDNAQDTVFFPNLVKVHLTGKVQVPDSTKVQLKSDQNAMQPLLSANVIDGEFVVLGELEEPNFYKLTVQGKSFTVYLENDKQYAFVGEVDEQGKLQSGWIDTDSKIMNDYARFTKTLEAKQNELTKQYANVRATMNNPARYQQSVEQSIAIDEQQKDLPKQISKRFLNASDVSPEFKLYLIKGEEIGKTNYASYHTILNSLPDSLKGRMLYREAELKVNHVWDFYENMPDFPVIHPRNPEGDSLMLERVRDKEALLFVFWSSQNDGARSDIQEIKKKAEALRTFGVMPIYITWEKNYDSWQKASEQLALGKHNYRLNAMDKDFMVSNYGVRKLPHYMLVNAGNLSVINEHFTYPLDGLLENKLKKELAQD